jgi:hypothetical protein
MHAQGIPPLRPGVVFEKIFSPETLLLAGAIVGGLLAAFGWCMREFDKPFSGGVLLAAVFGAGALIKFFKLLFTRSRPSPSLQLVPERDLGFPRGHAVAALVVGSTTAYLWSLRLPEI